MKTKLNIALEGTCSGDIVGGLLSWTGENLQALLFLKGGYKMIKKKTSGADAVEEWYSIMAPEELHFWTREWKETAT